jgi:hypothetical protein
MTREPTRTRRSVGRAGGKRISHARRCARKKLFAIALEDVPPGRRDVAHAKKDVPLVREEVARAPGIRLLARGTTPSRARRSRSIKRKAQCRFGRMRCGPALSRFHKMVTQTRQRTALSGRVTARYDPGWANVVFGAIAPARGSSPIGPGPALSQTMETLSHGVGMLSDQVKTLIAVDEDALALDEDVRALDEDALALREDAIAQMVARSAGPGVSTGEDTPWIRSDTVEVGSNASLAARTARSLALASTSTVIQRCRHASGMSAGSM